MKYRSSFENWTGQGRRRAVKSFQKGTKKTIPKSKRFGVKSFQTSTKKDDSKVETVCAKKDPGEDNERKISYGVEEDGANADDELNGGRYISGNNKTENIKKDEDATHFSTLSRQRRRQQNTYRQRQPTFIRTRR